VFEETIRDRVSPWPDSCLRIRPASLGALEGHASLGFREGLAGGAILAIEHLFAPGSIGLRVENGSPLTHAAPLQRAALA
jgi:hypothetical protein